MSEEKTVLLSIKLDTADLKKNAEIASQKVVELTNFQKILKKENQQGTVEYANLSAELKAQNLILRQSSQALEIHERLGHKQNLTIKEQGEMLSAGKIALRNYTAEEIASTESGRKLNEEVNNLNESLKKSEAGYGVHVREVGNYDKGIRGLKAELKDLKSQMVGLDAGSKEYQQASEKAGELGDKIKEVNENVKASSGGTGFEKLSNNLGLVKDDLMNLDFAGVSEKMKQMAVVSKGMTFKETLGGLKQMGSGLISLGKAILANPLFLMVGVILGVVAALQEWSDYSAEQAVKAQDKHTLALEKNIETIKTQQKTLERSQELELKRAELEGKSAEELGKIKLRHLSETNKKQIEEQKAFNKLSTDLSKDIATAERQGNEDRKNDLEDKKEDAEKSFIDLYNENLLYEDKRRNLILENNKAIREETKTATEKRLAEEQINAQKRLDFLYKLADLQLANEDKANANSYKRAEIKYSTMLNDANNSAQDLLQIQKDYNTELDALDKEAKKDAIATLDENKKREITDAKENQQLITEIDRKYILEKTAINIEYENKKKVRDTQSIKDTELFNKAKLDDERKTTNEIKLIDAELLYLKSKGNEDEKAMFDAFQKAKIDVLKDNAQKELLIENQTKEQKDLIRSKLALDTEKINNEEYKKTEEKETKKVEKTLTDKEKEAQKIAEITLQSATQLTDALSQITQNRIANELLAEQNKNDENQKQLQSQLDAGLISEAEFKSKKSELDATFKATESKLKKEAFEKEKQANIIKATMNTALAITSALPEIPLAVLAGILGAVQIGLIASQPTPKFAKGGLFGGNSHANGGTKGYFEDGTQIEVEKDESFFILNKRATPLISQLSNINMATGGVPLMANGGAIKFQNGGAVASSLSNNLDNQLNAQNQLLRMIELMPKPVVIVQDINDAQGNLATVENRANF
jgi:hypothetical protein